MSKKERRHEGNGNKRGGTEVNKHVDKTSKLDN
jgi:hypothetical protein